MNTLTVEFTGTPEAGKTTCIKKLKNIFESGGYTVDYIQESAEIVPSCFSKGSFDSHMWMRLHSIEMLLSERNTFPDILLVDRGLIDGIFYTYQFLSRNPNEEVYCSSLIQFLSQLDFLRPDFLFVFTVDPAVSIHRRGGEGRLVTFDYVTSYNQLLTSFLPSIPSPYQVVDSTLYSMDEIAKITYDKITSLLKNNLSS